jgi:hypothetical protein
MKLDLEISDRTHLALARAKEVAGPDEDGEFEPEAKVFFDSLASDIIRALLKPVVGQLAWVAWVRETARRLS